jgi:hypothetical protein
MEGIPESADITLLDVMPYLKDAAVMAATAFIGSGADPEAAIAFLERADAARAEGDDRPFSSERLIAQAIREARDQVNERKGGGDGEG